MKDRIVIDGVLYEKVIQSRGKLNLRGKFNQIYYDVAPNSIQFCIIDSKNRNSYYIQSLLSVEWLKGSRGTYDRVILSKDSYDNSDYDEVEMNFDLSRRDVMNMFQYVLKLDEKRTSPWDERSVKKLYNDLVNKYEFVNKDEFFDDYCSDEWRDYIDSGFARDDYWQDIVNGKSNFSGYDNDYTPDKQYEDEHRDYMDMVFGVGNWH